MVHVSGGVGRSGIGRRWRSPGDRRGRVSTYNWMALRFAACGEYNPAGIDQRQAEASVLSLWGQQWGVTVTLRLHHAERHKRDRSGLAKKKVNLSRPWVMLVACILQVCR